MRVIGYKPETLCYNGGNTVEDRGGVILDTVEDRGDTGYC